MQVIILLRLVLGETDFKDLPTFFNGVLITCFGRGRMTLKLPCDQKIFSNFFPGFNFGITLHSPYRIYFWAEFFALHYIILTATPKFHLF